MRFILCLIFVAAGAGACAAEDTALHYVSDNALMVVSVSPVELLASKSADPIRALFADDKSLPTFQGIPWTTIRRFTQIYLPPDAANRAPETVTVIHTNAPVDKSQVLGRLDDLPRLVEDIHLRVRFMKKLRDVVGPSLLIVDDRHVVLTSSEAAMRRAIEASKREVPSRWTELWKPLQSQPLACVLDNAAARAQWTSPELESFVPVYIKPLLDAHLKNLDALRIHSTKKAALDFEMSATPPKGVAPAETRKMLDTLLGVLRLQVAVEIESATVLEGEEKKQRQALLSVAGSLLGSLTMKNTETAVDATARLTKDDVKNMAVVALPPLLKATDEMRKTQSKNNLKQLGLAMHNYHDTHKKFPPPAVVGPDGKTLHSWRVAVLPFLGQRELYNQYRRNEPWDSAHNKTILSKMPAVFRHPNDAGNSTFSSYYGLVGTGTVFGKTTGVRIRDIIDGTSNSIMVVESKRKIPWTKPEDIPFDVNKMPELKLGGFHSGMFHVLMCDGATRAMPVKVDAKLLSYLIRVNDRQPVRLP